MTVLCLVELDADGPADASLRALTFAVRLAGSAAGGSPAGGSAAGGSAAGGSAAGGSSQATVSLSVSVPGLG
jgi:hypothetical protein